LRDEERYADLATLTRQIGLDAENARAYFAQHATAEPAVAAPAH